MVEYRNIIYIRAVSNSAEHNLFGSNNLFNVMAKKRCTQMRRLLSLIACISF